MVNGEIGKACKEAVTVCFMVGYNPNIFLEELRKIT
jgi:hypothetical protein